jgi:MoxR-like ATPase
MNIKFKNRDEIDFSTLFPKISEQDYYLLEDQELTINNDTFDKLKSKKFLDIEGYGISIDCIEFEDEQGTNKAQSEVLERVSEKFIYADSVVDVLMTAKQTNRNVLLWGRGGHGKSEITELVMKEMLDLGMIASKPYVMAFGDGLSEDKLYGGMNIEKYKTEGKIEYLPENSFMNHEIVIFEEIFDAPAPVLLGLKDIMTSGEFRQGNETFKVKTKVIIGLTNKSKEEFAEQDDSLKALAERFALTLKVEWDSYVRNDFITLFQKVYGTTFYKKHKEKLITLANIIEMNNAEGGGFVSPRTAVAAADLFTRGKSLKYVSEIDPSIITTYEKQIVEDEKNNRHAELLKKLEEYIDTYDLKFVDESETFLKELASMETEISGKEVDLSDLDFGSQNDREVKMNKCKYILSIIDRQNPTSSYVSSFTNMKKTVSQILKNFYDSIEEEKKVKDAKEGNVSTDNLPF